MGRKGIGKLAAFSIGDRYDVYTKTRDDKSWKTFHLNYHDLAQDRDTYDAECEELDELPSWIVKGTSDAEISSSGFIVVISNLRRSWTTLTDRALASQLSRRFCLSADRDNFALYKNGSLVDLSKHEYYHALKLVIFFGYDENEINNILGKSSNRSNIEVNIDYFSDDKTRDAFAELLDKGLKGWIGFVEKPTDLHRNLGENFSNVVVYIDGKIADDDLFRMHPDSTFASKYMVGEVQADYLQDIDDDAVTSSRQGLDGDNENVSELIRVMKSVRTFAIRSWNEKMEKNPIEILPSYIKSNEDYMEWIDGLDSRSKKINGRLLKPLKLIVDSDTSGPKGNQLVKSYLNGTIELIEALNTQGAIDEAESLANAEQPEEALEKILIALHALNISEACDNLKVARKRRDAISSLERLIESGATERHFQKLIAENPWMINPTWRPVPESVLDPKFKTDREHFVQIRNELGDSTGRIDILISIFDEGVQRSVIVELKRDKPTSYSMVSPGDIIDQIRKYRLGLIKDEPGFENRRQTDIPAIFIIPSKSGDLGTGNAIEFDRTDLDTLKSYNIQVIPYNELLSDCKRTLSEEIQAAKSNNERPFFDENEDAGIDNE